MAVSRCKASEDRGEEQHGVSCRYQNRALFTAVASPDHVNRRVDKEKHPPARAAECDDPGQAQARLGDEAADAFEWARRRLGRRGHGGMFRDSQNPEDRQQRPGSDCAERIRPGRTLGFIEPNAEPGSGRPAWSSPHPNRLGSSSKLDKVSVVDVLCVEPFAKPAAVSSREYFVTDPRLRYRWRGAVGRSGTVTTVSSSAKEASPRECSESSSTVGGLSAPPPAPQLFKECAESVSNENFVTDPRRRYLPPPDPLASRPSWEL